MRLPGLETLSDDELFDLAQQAMSKLHGRFEEQYGDERANDEPDALTDLTAAGDYLATARIKHTTGVTT